MPAWDTADCRPVQPRRQSISGLHETPGCLLWMRGSGSLLFRGLSLIPNDPEFELAIDMCYSVLGGEIYV